MRTPVRVTTIRKQHTMKRSLLLPLGVSMLLAITACGSDKGASSGPTTAASVTTTASGSATFETTSAAPGTTATGSTAPNSTAATTVATTALDDSALDELVAAAKKDGKLVWYTTAGQGTADNLVAAFKQRYGIDVEMFRAGNPDVTQRVQAEAAAGGLQADVVSMTRTGFITSQLAAGIFTPTIDAGIPGFPGDYPERFIFGDGAEAVVSISPWSFIVNTDTLPTGEVPDSWEDLLDPAYSGEILTLDPESTNSWIQALNVVRGELGDEYLSKLGGQDLRFYPSVAPIIEAVVAGEGSIGVPAIGSFLIAPLAQGAPVKLVVPSLTTGAEQEFAVNATAPHSNAARLFAHFLMSHEGQEVIASTLGDYSVYDTDGLPAQYVSPDPVEKSDVELIKQLFGV